MSARCFIALGSNLSQATMGTTSPLSTPKHSPQEIVESACTAITELGQIVNCSSWYRSQSILPGQPDYINGVLELQTKLNPEALLDALQTIENNHGRIRKQRWGARTLDLDILLYDTLVLNSQRLIIPHASMLERNFVLHPLLEIWPAAQLPNGSELNPIANKLGWTGLEKIS